MSRRYNYDDDDRYYSKDYSSNFFTGRLLPLLVLGAVIAAIVGIVKGLEWLFHYFYAS